MLDCAISICLSISKGRGPDSTHMPGNDAAAPGHVRPAILDIVQPLGVGISPLADMDQTIVTAALAAKRGTETPKKLGGNLVRKPCVVRSPVPQLRHDNHDFAQLLLYSSWRRHQRRVSLRPLGARSSHWYAPQRPSSPRA